MTYSIDERFEREEEKKGRRRETRRERGGGEDDIHQQVPFLCAFRTQPMLAWSSWSMLLDNTFDTYGESEWIRKEERWRGEGREGRKGEEKRREEFSASHTS